MDEEESQENKKTNFDRKQRYQNFSLACIFVIFKLAGSKTFCEILLNNIVLT